MKFALSTLVAGLAVALSAVPALAFGRGGFAARGAAIGPAGGVRTGGVAHGVSVGPLGGAHAGTVHGGSYYGPGGGSVQHIGGGGVTTGPLGGVHVGGGGATRVTGPGGHSVVTGHGGGATAGPLGGVRGGGGAGVGIAGPGGVAVAGHRGGAAVGPLGGVVAGGSRGGAVATPWGAAGGFARGGVAVGPGGVAAGGARAVGHTTGYLSPLTLRGNAFAIRSASAYPYFTRTWYTAHATAWVAPRWVVGYNLWVPPVWNTVATFVGVTAPPVAYEYGSSVVVNNTNVYVNGESVGTPEEYATQATEIADTGRTAKPAEADEWQPLGVFGMVQFEETVAQRIFQLAVNKAGVVRGNYYDAVADTTTPVYGSVDKKTQRVAWSIGEKKDIVFETGLPNLTKDESTVLIHYGKDRTEQQQLVRIEEPKDKK